MASKLTSRALRSFLSQPTLRQTATRNPAIWTASLASRASYSSQADLPPPPLLAKLKGDLKTAMRAKDATRLSVLRSVLAATLNASKTASPIQTDVQLVALLRKTARSCQESVTEFRGAGREDLAEKEEAQIRVLEEYTAGSGVESVSETQVREMAAAVKAALASEGITDAKTATGEAMKRLFAPGGPLDGKDVDKKEASKIVRGVIAAAA
ncbi:hypothetical protein B0T22DRAFT_145029 [Podospora appendiculata]|uniref:Altered inheritance of mitochondria protein 41 n=1 Tax=Podospora appendiculata TaxID=314037 RepID=A0AAE0X9D8_9PEZI|nr:hypothetical protein B0T22DRAFT_145029 [Podospora appendiculata]